MIDRLRPANATGAHDPVAAGDDAPHLAGARATHEYTGWVPVIFLVLVGLGGVLRLIAAQTLTPHVDEGASLLAAHAVVERGIPILPSGTVYTQGATLSYLTAPFVWLGLDQLSHLNYLRTVVVVVGSLAIYLAYRFASTVTGDFRVGIVMAALIAFDPLSIQWSGHLRMYGLLQAITFGLALAWSLFLAKGFTWPRALAVVLVYWTAVGTHLGSAALLGIAMFLSALWVHRKGIIRAWSTILTLAASGAGALGLMVLNSTLGSASVGDTEVTSSGRPFSFVGDNLLKPFALNPGEWNWSALTLPENLYFLVPGILVAIATMIGGRQMLRSGNTQARTGAMVALTMYWVPMLGVGLFTSSPKERYVLNAHLLGFMFAAVIVIAALDHWRKIRPDFNIVPPALAQGFTLFLLAALVVGTSWRIENPVVHPDHNAAMEYVVAHHQDGEPIIAALPAIAYLAVDVEDRDDLYFLAGEQNQSRARRYTRYTGEGHLIDYWVGAPAMVDPAKIRQFLRDNPNSWIVVDEHRLTENWAYAGVVEGILLDETVPVATTNGGGLVLRPSAHEAAVNHETWRLALAGEQ
jgi:hypothetical protein